jgi:prevent-host-death family protein
MKTATLTEAKNGLSALIDQVRAGESITILDRGTPVARLEPVVARPDQSGRLRRLERAGIVRVGSAPPPVALLRKPAPSPSKGRSAVAALLAERRSGR